MRHEKKTLSSKNLLFENVPNRNKLLIVRCYTICVNVNGGFVVEIIETKMTECVYRLMTANTLKFDIKSREKKTHFSGD